MNQYLIMVIFVLLSINSSSAMEKNLSILKYKPFFTLLINASGAAYTARINGVTVFEDYSGYHTNTSVPINHWMSTNENELELVVKSIESDKDLSKSTNIEIAIQVQEETKLDAPAIKLANILFNGSLHEIDSKGNAISQSMGVVNLDSMDGFRVSQSGDVKLQKINFEKYDDKRNFYRIKRKVIIPSNLPRWAFFDSDQIPDISEQSMSDIEFEKFRFSLYMEYLKVHEAIKNRKIDSIMPMYAERVQEYDAALYYPEGTMEKKIKVALEHAANDPDTELLDIKPEYLAFDIFKNNKLVRLLREDESKAIVQNFKKTQGSQSFDLIFRYKNGKWILTR